MTSHHPWSIAARKDMVWRARVQVSRELGVSDEELDVLIRVGMVLERKAEGVTDGSNLPRPSSYWLEPAAGIPKDPHELVAAARALERLTRDPARNPTKSERIEQEALMDRLVQQGVSAAVIDRRLRALVEEQKRR